MTNVVDVTPHGNVLVLRMAYGKANVLDTESCRALTAIFEESRMRSARALVLTGQGSIFSAGVDLVRVVEGGAAYVREFLPALNTLFSTLFSFPRPVVAAINGHAIAGGCILACAADYRVMARGPGRIGVPELLVGVPFPVAILEIVRFVVAPQFLQSTVYRAVTLAADTAQQQGLVDAAVDPDRLMDEAMAVAEEMASRPARAFEMTKHQLRAPTVQRMRDGAAIESAVYDEWATPETLDVIRAYVARTLKR